MGDVKDEITVAFDLLRRFGGKWAVLTAMSMDMTGKGIVLPPEVNELLKTARLKIESGCYSSCEVNCALAEVESRIFSQCHRLSDQEFMNWTDLLGEAMQGKLNYQRIRGIRALDPVKNDCSFLECTCS
jgi:hypothetical protein